MLDVTVARRLRLVVLAAIAVLMFSGLTSTEAQSISDSRRRVWATHIAQLLREPPGWAQVEHHETEDLAFSPDDQRLAVTITHHELSPDKKLRSNVHVFVFDEHSRETDVHQFDLFERCGSGLAWNETGSALLVCGTVLRLADGGSCYPVNLASVARKSIRPTVLWLDSEHIVLSQTGEILDMACTQVGKWPLEPGWRIGAVADSKNWVLLEHCEQHPPNWACEYSIVDSVSSHALLGWPAKKSPWGASPMLAVGAEVLCLQLLEGKNVTNGRLHCWAIKGGNEIPVPKKARKTVPNQAATFSARAIVEKWEYDRDPWWNQLLFWWVPVPGFPPLPRQRVVLDLRSGQWISAWKPRIQDSHSPYITDHAYHCALSARGDLVAESGDGEVDLHRLAP